jgi:hypothetical protein
MNTGIVARNWNSRGLITHNADTKPLVRQTDGTLWAAIKENALPNFLNLYRSQDSGFSWERVWSGNFALPTSRKVGLGDLNTNGPHLTLQVFEDKDLLILWQSYYDTGAGSFDVEPFVWKLSAPGTRLTDAPWTGTVQLSADSLAIDVPYNDVYQFIIHTYGGNLVVKQYTTQYQTAAMGTYGTGGSFFDIFQGVAHEAGWLDIVALDEVDSKYVLKHIRYDALEGNFGAHHVIHDSGGTADIVDVGIARDGWGNLCAVWSQENVATDNMDGWFSLSEDAGATWIAPKVIPKEIGHSAYMDPATARLAVRTRVLGGRQGFILGYVHKNASEVPKTFVRTLLTTNGTDYALGPQKEIATNVAQAAEPVTGLSWFRPPGTALLDLADPGQVRIGFSMGEGNSRIQTDSQPVRIGQQLLYESAYPSSLASNSGTYTTEGPNAFQLQVNFNILGAPNENVDYYGLGLIGHITKRYMAAFQKVGTELRFQRFEPDPLAEMDDRSAYYAPVEYTSLAILDPQSYQFPVLGQRGQDSYESFVERDVRRIYLPPNAHLARTLLVNRGNFLKRTIWIVTFDGNDYEVSQVVPRMLDGFIAHYDANAYVVGPSNDPFSRRVLPSET